MLTERQDKIWQSTQLAESYLQGVRGAIPLGAEQLDTILRLVRQGRSQVDNFLDLGCGNGVLGRAIHECYPQASGIFLDFSEMMLQAARNNFDAPLDYISFIQEDFSKSEWTTALSDDAPFDLIVSGFAIHHQSDKRKKALYSEIYQLLKPGGLFLNLEHVASRSPWSETAFNDLFIDSLYAFHEGQGNGKSREEIAEEFYHRPDKEANMLAPVESQCDWLREIGFTDVECFFKLLEIALFGGMRPTKGLSKLLDRR